MTNLILKEFQQLNVVNNVPHLCPTGKFTFEWAPRTDTSPTQGPDGTPIIYISEPTDNERHIALGRFMDAWSRLEQALGVMLTSAMGVALPFDHVLMNALGLKGSLDILKVLGPLNLNPEEQSTLLSLLARLKTNNTRRNNIVHGKWVLELRLYDWNGKIGSRSYQYRYYEPSDPEELDAIDPKHPKSKEVRKKYLFSVTRINALTAEIKRLAYDMRKFNARNLGLAEGQKAVVVEHRPRHQP